jgi:hypothetical protein
MTLTKVARAMLSAAALVAATGGAARAHDDLPPAIEQTGASPSAPVSRGPGLWRVSVGGRSSLLRSPGYDPFSTDDAFGQFSAMATRAVVVSQRFSTAAGALWEAGTATSTARGADSSLALQRVGIVLEERFAPRPWIYVFGRLTPTWTRGQAEIDDLAIAAPLRTSFSTFGADASAGVAARLNPGTGKVGLWLMGDGGYGWAPSQHMVLAPALPAADRDKAGTTTLADLAPSGVFARFALALSY